MNCETFMSMNNETFMLNYIYHGSCLKMEKIPDNSIQLIITSPPYNCNKEYEKKLMTFEEYKEFSLAWLREAYRVLAVGGRLCIVIGAIGRKPFADLPSYLSVWAVDEIKFLHRGKIIWFKLGRSGDSTAWGSWLSPSNCFIRDTTEEILVFLKSDPILADKILDLTENIIILSKEQYKLENKSGVEFKIPKKDFLANSINVWVEKPETNIKWHPAPFPVKIARRLIMQYSFPGDVVLDMFMGAGTTAVACLTMKQPRFYVGYEIKASYIKMANARINKWKNKKLTDFLPSKKVPNNLLGHMGKNEVPK